MREVTGNPILRDKVLEWMGRDPHPTGALQGVWKINSPIPGTLFEWHPKERRVYLVELKEIDGKTHGVGTPIAYEIVTHGDAINAALVFCRGISYYKSKTQS